MSYNSLIFNISRPIFSVLVFELNFEFGHDMTILKMAEFNNVDHLKLNQHYLKVSESEILRQQHSHNVILNRDFQTYAVQVSYAVIYRVVLEFQNVR